jgi:hypothetical protein
MHFNVDFNEMFYDISATYYSFLFKNYREIIYYNEKIKI